MTANAATARALTFDCDGDTLVGILDEPAEPPEVGLIFVVGGPQYRVGSHRQFVQLARAIAFAGFAVLRFDYRGMGDSGGRRRDFESISSDIATAIRALQTHVPSVQRLVLLGLCDGASASLLYLERTNDARVKGLCLFNPWVRSDLSFARTNVRHYYVQRLGQRGFWLKLLGGRVGAAAWKGLLTNLRAQYLKERGDDSYQARMSRAWTAFDGQILLVLSGSDYTAKEFIDVAERDALWTGALDHPRLRRVDLEAADHTFSVERWREEVTDSTVQWLRSWAVSAPLERWKLA